jgi:hypothetical protein
MTDMLSYSFQAFATNNAWKKIYEHGATIRQKYMNMGQQ